MIKAMEDALHDHMQILNMSIGDAFNAWPESPTAAAASKLVDKGMVVVASIGNDGANGLYLAGAPAVGDNVIGVASYDNTNFSLPTFTVSPDSTSIGYETSDSPGLPPTSGSFPMARTGTSTSTADACTALPAGSLTGMVALVRRGGCSFYQKSSTRRPRARSPWSSTTTPPGGSAASRSRVLLRSRSRSSTSPTRKAF